MAARFYKQRNTMNEKRPRGRPPTVIKLHKRTVSFPPNLYARLERTALKEERNVNELIVDVLRDELERREQVPA